MHIVTNRVYVHPDWQQEFEQRFEKRVGQIEQQAGFRRMQILRPVSDQTPYLVYTEWEDEQAFKNWVGSDDFKLAHQNPLPEQAFSQEGSLEQHTLFISATGTN